MVPETFHVLLSQRRRWINSTIHNLMELVLVSDLCGIACLSMQFVVFMDLLGTAMLPAAVALAVYVIVMCAMMDQPQILPITVLVAILGLPAVLIVLTTRKVSMFGWMLVCENQKKKKKIRRSKRLTVLILLAFHRFTCSHYLFGTSFYQYTHSGILMTSRGATHAESTEIKPMNVIRKKTVILMVLKLQCVNGKNGSVFDRGGVRAEPV